MPQWLGTRVSACLGRFSLHFGSVRPLGRGCVIISSNYNIAFWKLRRSPYCLSKMKRFATVLLLLVSVVVAADVSNAVGQGAASVFGDVTKFGGGM